MSGPVQDNTLAYVNGQPGVTAGFKQTPEDFRVDEVLGFEPDGQGEHLFLQVRKRALTSKEVLARLASHFGVREPVIGYAGMKDKQGVCSQWFSICLPGSKPESLQLDGLENDSLQVLQHAFNGRKLRQGTHTANRFSIVLRGVEDSAQELEQRLLRIREQGVPNYFGEQRFGRDGENINRAMAMFEGRYRCSRYQKGILLSAARSEVFNRILSNRVAAGSWNTWVPGDVMNLAGSRSVFATGEQDEGYSQRLQSQDIHVTGALWGRGRPAATLAAGEAELQVAEQLSVLCQGLEAFGLTQDRRSLRLPVQDMVWERPAEGSAKGSAKIGAEGDLRIQFSLPPGGYATAVLRELFQYRQAVSGQTAGAATT